MKNHNKMIMPPKITKEFQAQIQKLDEHDCHAGSEDGCTCGEYSEEYPYGDNVTEPYDIRENR